MELHNPINIGHGTACAAATAFYARREGAHMRVRVFTGPDRAHRAFSGELVLREEDWIPFLVAQYAGVRLSTGLYDFQLFRTDSGRPVLQDAPAG